MLGPSARTFFRIFIIINLAFVALLGLRFWTGKGEATALVPAPPVIAPTPAFTFVDHNGRESTLASLQGRAWLIEFIYTRCPSQCPRMNERLQALSRELPVGMGFLSVTCDPAHDTPEVLSDYARTVTAPGRTWIFAASDKDSIDRLADGLLIGRSDAHDLHSLRWVLIDAEGAIRGHYDSEDSEHLRRLVRDARSLA